MQEINTLEANNSSFQEILIKYLPFPHPGISFMIKDLSQIKVHTYFSKGDDKTLVELKEKKGKFSRSCSYTHLSANLGFFCLVCSKF